MQNRQVRMRKTSSQQQQGYISAPEWLCRSLGEYCPFLEGDGTACLCLAHILPVNPRSAKSCSSNVAGCCSLGRRCFSLQAFISFNMMNSLLVEAALRSAQDSRPTYGGHAYRWEYVGKSAEYQHASEKHPKHRHTNNRTTTGDAVREASNSS